MVGSEFKPSDYIWKELLCEDAVFHHQIDDDEDDFEFAIVDRDPDLSPFLADKIFNNSQIWSVFPIFNRVLLFVDGDECDSKPQYLTSLRFPIGKIMTEEPDNDNPPCSYSSKDELEGIPNEFTAFGIQNLSKHLQRLTEAEIVTVGGLELLVGRDNADGADDVHHPSTDIKYR
ncbi:hypothetical protein NE237_022685 [Protea cynaroides]|uniref:Uncharacterized protein n=1 Tax=Protea cynaroides TaxID=273540 RepID=A0A9Q0K4G0_9MAGN|nr:hypothetical protein NE237_022685 [Protea cynaroides]